MLLFLKKQKIKDLLNTFHRNKLVLGEKTIKSLEQIRVILFGVGGVGSWCAEALIRSGVKSLTLVDPDIVCQTNLNRQLQATLPNIGKSKVAVLSERLMQINPNAKIEALPIAYNEETSKQFNFNQYDYLIDAIDSLSSKVALLIQAMQSTTTIFSAMGAANKLDPTFIQTTSIWKTKQCPLARFVRKRLRRHHVNGDFICVYSNDKVSPRKGEDPHGSLVYLTGIFGFFLAGLVVQDVYAQTKLNREPTH